MPRVNLGRDLTKERQEATSKIIRMAMIRQGITKQADIAVRFGRSQQWFSQKLKKGNWSLEDMVKLCKILKLSADDAAVILGVKRCVT